MNYDLALKLNNAGFPQRKGLDGDDEAEQIKYGFSIYGCVHKGRCGSNIFCETSVYFPRLSELIEACGEKGFVLHAPGTVDVSEEYWMPSEDKWTAFKQKPVHTLKVHGSTPEEAVANLWLELNETK